MFFPDISITYVGHLVALPFFSQLLNNLKSSVLRLSISEQVQSAGAAVPVMDLTKAAIINTSMDDDEDELVFGGQVLGMRWDQSGERLAVSFQESNWIALFCTRLAQTRVSMSPLQCVEGEPDESPSI